MRSWEGDRRGFVLAVVEVKVVRVGRSEDTASVGR